MLFVCSSKLEKFIYIAIGIRVIVRGHTSEKQAVAVNVMAEPETASSHC